MSVVKNVCLGSLDRKELDLYLYMDISTLSLVFLEQMSKVKDIIRQGARTVERPWGS